MRRYLQLIVDHGPLHFTRKALGEIDRAFLGSRVARRRFQSAMRAGRPYFGSYLSANQGNFRRHKYMDRIVALQSAAVPTGVPIDILEVGSYAGVSAVVWSKAIRRHHGSSGSVLCVDPWETLFSLDDGSGGILTEMTNALRDGTIFRLFEYNVHVSGVADIVSHRKAMFHDIAESIEGEPRRFDIVYIDGDHRRSAVLRDLALGARLLKPAGVLCGDDLELQMDEVDRDAALHHAERDFVIDPRSRRFFHPGVCVAVNEFFNSQRVSAWHGFWAMQVRDNATFKSVTL